MPLYIVLTHSDILLTCYTFILACIPPDPLLVTSACEVAYKRCRRWKWHTKDVAGESGRQQPCSHSLLHCPKVHPHLRQEEYQRWRQGAACREGGDEEGCGSGHKGLCPWDPPKGSLWWQLCCVAEQQGWTSGNANKGPPTIQVETSITLIQQGSCIGKEVCGNGGV